MGTESGGAPSCSFAVPDELNCPRHPTWDKPLFLENIFPNNRVIDAGLRIIPINGMVESVSRLPAPPEQIDYAKKTPAEAGAFHAAMGQGFLKSPASAVLNPSGRTYLRSAAFTASGVKAEIFLSISADHANVRPRSR